jgi:hypothetical protein
VPHPDHCTSGNDLVAIVYEAWWVSGPVWTGAESLSPTGIQSLDCPACSESLYQLSCAGSSVCMRAIEYCCGEVCTSAMYMVALASILSMDACLVKVYHNGFVMPSV